MHRTSLYKVRVAIWGFAAVAVLTFAGAFSWRMLHPPELPSPVVTGEAAIRNAYSLTDHTGQAVTAETYAGRWQLVFFGFTYCPDICPTTLAYLASAMDSLGPEAERVVPIFITVDPARDTAEVMGNYVSAFHPRMVGLTGTEAQVAEAAGNFRVWYERSENETAPDGYLMAHPGHIYLMRPDGRFEDVFIESDQSAGDLAKHISSLIENEERSG
ncbi:SCO family protein [Leisingera daeponensis]|uniref:SCO family protein n=1 Tax=Leisingera daeponensis TaxID=405746 RepID=UPI001C97E9D1|nr:SCO family protein [Leisingera daeponensis]MBY6058973.1 SCO family protein [Leisingera daeponensis]